MRRSGADIGGGINRRNIERVNLDTIVNENGMMLPVSEFHGERRHEGRFIIKCFTKLAVGRDLHKETEGQKCTSIDGEARSGFCVGVKEKAGSGW
jgi:hypothetical protein